MYTYNADVVRNLNIIDEVEYTNAKLRDKRQEPSESVKRSATIAAEYIREIKRQGKKDKQGNHVMDPVKANFLLAAIIKRNKRLCS